MKKWLPEIISIASYGIAFFALGFAVATLVMKMTGKCL